MEIEYRQGEKKDCSKIAELINIASGGVVKFLFHDLVPGMSPVEMVAYNHKKDIYPHTYKNTIIAICKNEVVGMVLSYPSSYHKITDEMREFFPEDRIEHLKDLYLSHVENSWYIDALCVEETFQRKGIGKKLISLTREKAIGNNNNSLSLIAFADNLKAISLYKKNGFKTEQKIKLDENEFIKHQNGCLLMKCDIL